MMVSPDWTVVGDGLPGLGEPLSPVGSRRNFVISTRRRNDHTGSRMPKEHHNLSQVPG